MTVSLLSITRMIPIRVIRVAAARTIRLVGNCMSRTRVVHCNEPHDIYIGRPSKWGNPFHIGPDGSRDEVIAKYAEWIKTQPHLLWLLSELKGKTLGCYCKPAACHGDVLVALIEET
jgi:hypothetical protein